MGNLYSDESVGSFSSSRVNSGGKCLWAVFLVTLIVLLLVGCGCDFASKSSAERIAAFEKAGPIVPKVDVELLVKSRIQSGPYRVVPGDVLEFQIPMALQPVSSEYAGSLEESKPYLCRVNEGGNIALPIIGELNVANRTLEEVEELVTEAYYPKYVVNCPVVVCSVTDYRIRNVTVTGAVEEPGTYQLKNDEMSLVSVLMKAGGIVKGGARYITIKRAERWWSDKLEEAEENPDEDKESAGGGEQATFGSYVSRIGGGSAESDFKYEYADLAVDSEVDSSGGVSGVGRGSGGGANKPIVLPIKGLNVPFADVALREGDIVEVERMDPQVFTVMGLVNKPGAFDYPGDVKYTLVHALGFAGGVNLAADPHYVSIYRQDANERIVSATFRIDGRYLANAANVMIKPGDVINVEVTPRTRRNLMLDRMLRLNVGVYVKPLED